MSFSTPFIRRPVATILLTFGVAAAGAIAFFKLPVSPLPQVDFPTISVTALLPGGSPEVVATTVATPLERHLGQIADVTEMTSSSTVGTTRINLQFGLDRDINGAARDVQAAINAAAADLPTNLRATPTYRKVNPADAPILILALTSDTKLQGELYDAADSVVAQRLSQVEGVGQVVVGGSALPAVRVEVNPMTLQKYAIGLEDLRAALAAANAHSPKGDIESGDRHYQIDDNDQASKADQYRSLIIAYRNGAPVRVSDVGETIDSVEDLRNAGLANGKPAVLVIIYRQPNANIVGTVDRVMSQLPELRASISPAIDITPAVDRSVTIRASLADVERTLVLAGILVVLVVFLFLRSARATLVPGVAVPVSLIGTFGVMYLLGYSLDNLSLMALTVATGFVVDDAIVVLENISRHIESGMSPLQASLKGAAEVSFTVLSMSISLIAVFIPILLMGGIVGRLFREFAVTLSVAILVSLAVSLATTPMMCALLLRRPERQPRGRFYRWSERGFVALQRGYDRSLNWALNHAAFVMVILAGTLCLNFYLFVIVPKGFFPQQDTGRIAGSIQADQAISFQLMRQKLQQFISIIRKDRAVDTVVGFTGVGTGGGQATNSGTVFMSLKPIGERNSTVDQVIGRLRREVAQIPGASLYMQAVQDIRVGGRSSNAQYQYTLQDYNADELFEWAPKITAELQTIPILTQVNSDQQNNGMETNITVDRATAARFGLTVSQIDNSLYDAFGQRQVSTIYNPLNQYHVVMEVASKYWQNPDTLKDIYISTSGGTASGTQTTNATAGTVSGPPAAATAASSSACSPAPAAMAQTTATTTTSSSATTASTTSSSSSATSVTTSSGALTALITATPAPLPTTPTTSTTSTTANTSTTLVMPTTSRTSTTSTTSTAATTTSGTTGTTLFSPITSSTPTAAASATITAPASTCASPAAASGSSASTAAAAVASSAVRNQALNSIGNTGNSVASSGSAVSTSAETMIPLSAFTHIKPGNVPLSVNHQGLTVAATISFNLAPGAALGDAVREVNAAVSRLQVPPSIHGTFQGTARAFQQSIANEPYLILAAVIAVYIVLGILYESYIHPFTILSTLPSAGIGAVLALMLLHTEFSIMALIGVILLIGIVKKNAIMMIDFALDAERSRGLSSRQAIYEACMLRFRPILMTTMAALLGALPLAAGLGNGGELRQPLGIAIVGGLIVSQMLTLYTTPVIYLYLDRFSLWLRSLRGGDVAHAQ
jgi:multidrug efflux pump